MINFRIISKIIGSLLFIEAFFMTWCAAIAIYFHEEDQIAFLMSLLITFGSGFLFLLWGRNAENALSRKDAYLLVTAVWAIFSVFGMFPFLIQGSITNLTDAYFETMSGFSTTGATIIDDVEVLPHGILFWRSLMQWIGGLGIVFFTIAILPSLVGGSVNDDGKVDLVYLSPADDRLWGCVLAGWHELVRCHELLHDDDRHGGILNPQRLAGILP